MSKLNTKIICGAMFVMLSGNVLAECNKAELAGDWKVFYRNDAYPTSVLAAGEAISIQLDSKSGSLSVQLTDPDWQGWNESWETVCIDGHTILLGAIQQRSGKTTLVLEIGRVVKAGDSLSLSTGEVKARQVNIRFPQPYAALEHSESLSKLAEQGLLSSHPGHAHGWD